MRSGCTELITGAKNNDENIAASLVLSLAHVVRSAHENMGEKATEACIELALDAFKQTHGERSKLKNSRERELTGSLIDLNSISSSAGSIS